MPLRRCAQGLHQRFDDGHARQVARPQWVVSGRPPRPGPGCLGLVRHGGSALCLLIVSIPRYETPALSQGCPPHHTGIFPHGSSNFSDTLLRLKRYPIGHSLIYFWSQIGIDLWIAQHSTRALSAFCTEAARFTFRTPDSIDNAYGPGGIDDASGVDQRLRALPAVRASLSLSRVLSSVQFTSSRSSFGLLSLKHIAEQASDQSTYLHIPHAEGLLWLVASKDPSPQLSASASLSSPNGRTSARADRRRTQLGRPPLSTGSRRVSILGGSAG